MLLRAIRSVAIFALMTTMIFPSVSADDYDEKWGDNIGGKSLDNRFIVGNWKQKDEERKHLSDPPEKIEGPLAKFRKLTDPPNVLLRSTGKRGGTGGNKMADHGPRQQNWGNLVGEGADKRFWIGSLRRMDTNDIEPSNATLPRRGEEQLLMHLFCRLKSSKYSNVTAGSNPYDISRHELQCHDILPLPPDSPEGCKVNYNYVKYVQLWKNPEGNFSCFCNMSAKPKAVAANKVCCKYECCKDLANRCNNSSYPDRPDHTFCEAFKVIDIPHSTTAPKSGSAPTRRQEDLALVAAAILIYIHRRGQANFL